MHGKKLLKINETTINLNEKNIDVKNFSSKENDYDNRFYDLEDGDDDSKDELLLKNKMLNR